MSISKQAIMSMQLNLQLRYQLNYEIFYNGIATNY